MLNLDFKKAANKDFFLISVFTVWLIASLLYAEVLEKRLFAADGESAVNNILGLAFVIAAVAPYVLLTTKIFQVSVILERATSGLQRACIALGFMVLLRNDNIYMDGKKRWLHRLFIESDQ